MSPLRGSRERVTWVQVKHNKAGTVLPAAKA